MNYAVLGGDLRIIKLVQMLANDKNKVYIYALEKAVELKEDKSIKFCNKIEDAVKDVQAVIGPIPFSKNEKQINTPFSEKNVEIKEIISILSGKTFIVGSISNEICNDFKKENINVIDVMKDEELAVLNTIATAEGGIQAAIENTTKILHGSKILILGFGRVAKTLAVKLKGLSANVTCAARKPEDKAWIQAYGYNYVNINALGENLSQFDIIMNTVPNLILTKDRLQYVNKECLLIDLSSKPGGMDEEAIKEYGLNMKWALALPGKVAPTTTAKFIKEIIYRITKEI